MKAETCSVENCGRKVHARTWCHMHYCRVKRRGSLFVDVPPQVKGDPESRFWAKVNKDGPDPSEDTLAARLGPCWLWSGALGGDGYGRFSVSRRTLGAHRFAYELLVGPIPEGLTIDHLCRVPRCVNPAHLEAVTVGENVLRGDGESARRARQTHCKNGHLFDEANTYINPRGGRQCRACDREFKRRRVRVEAALLKPNSLVPYDHMNRLGPGYIGQAPVLTLRVPPQDRDALDHEAEQLGVPRSEIVRRLIADHLLESSGRP